MRSRIPGAVKGRASRAAGAAAAALLAGALAVACGLDLHGLRDAPPDASVDGASGDGTLDVESDGSEEGGDAPLDQSAERHEASAVDAMPDGMAEATADADATGDGGDSAVDACEAGGAETCNNGIDDNCDGLVDCADPLCAQQGYTCAPAAPPGWELVAYDETAAPACAAGWGSPTTVVENPDGGGACECFCGAPLGNACEHGTAAMSLGQNACGCGSVQNVPLYSDGGCNPIGVPIGRPCGPWGDGLATTLGPTTVACAENPKLPPVTFQAQGQTCVPAQPAGAGCSPGGACLPTVAPSAECLLAAGVQSTCPAGFPRLHLVYDPSSVVDQRQCGSCGCKSTPASCNTSAVTLYLDPSCATPLVSIPANAQCDALFGDPTDAGWFMYTASPNTTACAAGASTTGLDGGLLFPGAATICCP